MKWHRHYRYKRHEVIPHVLYWKKLKSGQIRVTVKTPFPRLSFYRDFGKGKR